jgi:hypothetical protein
MISSLIKYFSVVLLLTVSIDNAYGQEGTSDNPQTLRQLIDQYKPGQSRFLLRGYADATFFANKEESSFGNARLVPVFVYKQSDKLLFEGELEFEVEDGEVKVVLEYANMYYQLGSKATLRMGKILVPFGIFFDRLHPSWINRLPTLPMGYGHDGIIPTSDLGVELRSGIYLGNMKANYSIYVLNGPTINTGEHEAEEIGMLVNKPGVDNNNNKAVGGRFGAFPFRDQSLELGFSAQSGKLGNRGSEFEDVSAFLYAFDWTYVKNISFLKGIIDVKGQLNFINIEDQTYVIDEDGVIEEFNFDNSSKSTFFQLAYRPTMSANALISSLELVGRYSTLNTPDEAPWATENTQMTLGLNYWIDWRTAIKFAYQKDKIDSHEAGKTDSGVFFLQWTLGF